MSRASGARSSSRCAGAGGGEQPPQQGEVHMPHHGRHSSARASNGQLPQPFAVDALRVVAASSSTPSALARRRSVHRSAGAGARGGAERPAFGAGRTRQGTASCRLDGRQGTREDAAASS